MLDLKNKVALVTGSGQGIGLAIAKRFASLGCQLVVNGLEEAEKLEEVRNGLADEYGAKVISFRADVSKSDEVSNLYDVAIKEFGKVDIVVNNAGITRDNLILRMSEGDWDKVLEVNLKSAFLVSKRFIRAMLKLGRGRIINISSVVGQMGNAGQVNYSASKAGLIGFSKSLARELAGKKITVNAIAPGYIDTEMTEKIGDKAREALLDLIPLKRYGSREDIAGVAAFLASDFSDYITGQVIPVNGGMFM